MKICSQCGETKPFEDFHVTSKHKDGRQYYCKECAKKYYTKWQDKNPESRARYQKWKHARRAESRSKIIEYFESNPCTDCGNSDIRVLVFDHVRGEKVSGVMALVQRGHTWETVKGEIDKCEVRCANCHLIVTQERGNFWLANYDSVV